MRIEDAVAELTLQTRSGDCGVTSEGVLLPEEVPLTRTLAPRTAELPVERIQSPLLGLELVLVPLEELHHQVRVHLTEQHVSSVDSSAR